MTDGLQKSRWPRGTLGTVTGSQGVGVPQGRPGPDSGDPVLKGDPSPGEANGKRVLPWDGAPA